MQTIVELKNINKSYTIGSTAVPVLKQIDLKILSGEMVAITGPSGSGKSTLMNIIGFLDYPDSGSYSFDGTPYHDYSQRRLSKIRNEKIGFVFQSFNLLPDLTALENVELPLLYRHISRKNRLEIATHALEQVGLSDRMRHKPTQLSGGQKQRVAIARAIAAAPPVILADEPTGNLDSSSGENIMRYLHSLHKSGITIIVITHDPTVAKTADRQIHIADGRITNAK